MRLPREIYTMLFLGCLGATGCGSPNRTESDTGIKIPDRFLAGKAVYDAGCSSCHDSSRDGAPRLGYLPAWSRRLAQGEATLLQHAVEGLDLMPPRGDNADLSDQQVLAAVRYMIFRAELNQPASH